MSEHVCEWCSYGPLNPRFRLCGRCYQNEVRDEQVNDRLLYESTEPHLSAHEREAEVE